MISAIQNINLSPSRFKVTKKPKKEGTSFVTPIKTEYPKNKINFKGYMEAFQGKSFQDTLNENYFQLPKIYFKDGSNYQLRPDKSQFECAKKIYNGDSVVFCAPTGTGKTAVAHYAITKNLNEHKTTIYTTPLKALANDKLREFRKIYGEDNVGLLTGDIKLNTNAPIQIMTTEIYNNQAGELNKNSKNIGTVIFDESHYLGDEDRGNIWENSIIKTPLNKIQILCLSATVGNSTELSDWIQSLNPTRQVSKVELPSEERFVPLVYHLHRADYHKDPLSKGEFVPLTNGEINIDEINPFNLSEKQKRGFEVIYKKENGIFEYYEMTSSEYKETAQKFKNLMGEESYNIEGFKNALAEKYEDLNKNEIEEVAQLFVDDSTKTTERIHTKKHADNYPALVQDLQDQDMLPALIFKLSRRACSDVAENLKNSKVDLTNDEEKEKIEEIIEDYKSKGLYLGTNFDKKMLLSGYGYHHAGELPQYRKLIEDLFSKKLLKVVVATSTLSAGINMPARTVVISDTTFKKYNPETNEVEYSELSANDFHQMAGRAGRRGVDTLGHVVLYNLQTPEYGFKELKPKSAEDLEKKQSRYELAQEKIPDELQLAYNLIDSKADKLRSHFKPDWQLLAQYYDENSDNENLKKLISMSFKTYLSKTPEKEQRSLLNKFENYKGVLLKQGFLEKNHHGEIKTTPKGKILKMSQGMNPLMLASMIYDETLKDLDIEQLCQMAGYIAGSDNQLEDENLSQLLNQRLSIVLDGEKNIDKTKQDFNKVRDLFVNKENKVLRSVREGRLKPEEIVMSESFSGYASFLFAHLNDKNNNSVVNFRKVTGTGSTLSNEQLLEMKDASKEYMRKSQEGSVYKIISQVVSILKQIDKICDYAIENNDIFPNNEYYKDLKEKAELAIILMKQNPVYDEMSV